MCCPTSTVDLQPAQVNRSVSPRRFTSTGRWRCRVAAQWTGPQLSPASEEDLDVPADLDTAPEQRSTRSAWLLRRYAATRDPRDLDALVQRFRPLARRLALRYVRGGEPLDDLEQVANLGLVKALQRFDPARGYAFTSFAVPTILGELKRSFRDSAWAAHVPRSVQERSARVRETAAALEAEHGHAPSVGEIASRLGASEETVLDALAALGALSSLSLDAPAPGEEKSVTIGDHLGEDETGYRRAEDLEAVRAALPALTDAQRLVLQLRF